MPMMTSNSHMHHQCVQVSSERISMDVNEHSDPVLPQVRKWIEVSIHHVETYISVSYKCFDKVSMHIENEVTA